MTKTEMPELPKGMRFRITRSGKNRWSMPLAILLQKRYFGFLWLTEESCYAYAYDSHILEESGKLKVKWAASEREKEANRREDSTVKTFLGNYPPKKLGS